MALAVEQKVERMVAASESMGRKIGRIIIEGKKIELVYVTDQANGDSFDLVDFSKK